MGCPSPLTMPLIADSDCDGQHTFVLGVQPLRRSVKEGNPHRENRASRQLHGRKLFAAADGHGGTLITEAAQAASQLVPLTTPHTG